MSGNNPINVALNPKRTSGLGQSHNTHNSLPSLKVVVRMDFLERGSDYTQDFLPEDLGDTNHEAYRFSIGPDSRPPIRICDANVEILNTDGTATIRTATTDLTGTARLDIMDLNGIYRIRITTYNAAAYNGQRRTANPTYRIHCIPGTGPLIQDDPIEDTHELIFRPVVIFNVELEGGVLKRADDPFTLPTNPAPTQPIDRSRYGFTHGRIGNRIHPNIIQGDIETGEDPVLPVDMRPVWWKNVKSYNARNITDVTYVCIHRTGAPNDRYGKALSTAEKNQSAAHYYMGHCGHICKVIQHSKIAQHAGGRWARLPRVNDYTIGIEVLNKYPPDVSPYLRYQYYALIELIHDLQNTYGLDPDKVISHSEVKMTARYPDNATPPAPGPPGSWIYDEGTHGKEQDPGQHFDWTQLEEAGIGRKLQGDVDLATAYGGFFHFFHDKSLKMGDSDGPTPTRPTRPTREFGGMRNDIDRVTVSPMGPVEELQRDLELIGYSLGPENSAGLRSNVGQYDDNTRRAVKRFQLHFLSGPTRTPHLRNGQVNATLATMIKQVLNYLTQSP